MYLVSRQTPRIWITRFTFHVFIHTSFDHLIYLDTCIYIHTYQIPTYVPPWGPWRWWLGLHITPDIMVLQSTRTSPKKAVQNRTLAKGMNEWMQHEIEPKFRLRPKTTRRQRAGNANPDYPTGKRSWLNNLRFITFSRDDDDEYIRLWLLLLLVPFPPLVLHPAFLSRMWVVDWLGYHCIMDSLALDSGGGKPVPTIRRPPSSIGISISVARRDRLLFEKWKTKNRSQEKMNPNVRNHKGSLFNVIGP